MYYVYILKHPSEDDIYIGFSTDLCSRMKAHKSEHREWRLACYEAYASETDARARERRLKVSRQREAIAEETDHAEPGDGLK